MLIACNRTYDGPEGRIVSPGWPGNFQPGESCQFVIQSPSNTTISLYFNVFRLLNSRNCTESSLEVSSRIYTSRKSWNEGSVALYELECHIEWLPQRNLFAPVDSNELYPGQQYIWKEGIENFILYPAGILKCSVFHVYIKLVIILSSFLIEHHLRNMS